MQAENSEVNDAVEVDRLAEEDFIEYAGFWRRVAASLIDSILMIIAMALLAIPLSLIGVPIMDGYTGSFRVVDLIPAVIVILFWFKLGATPGKQLLDCQIVDARTGHPLTLGQSVLRYLGYILNVFTFFIGFLWIAWSSRKQGFHDYIAKTVVVHKYERLQDPVADKPLEEFIREHQ